MATQPERWQAQADDAAVLRLNIPADGQRRRVFEISLAMQVRAVDGANAPWHEMRVEANGELEWQRRVPTEHPADYDGLDYRFQRSVGVGRELRIRLLAAGQQVRRLRLQIEADEVL
jgi:hypothetical protein